MKSKKITGMKTIILLRHGQYTKDPTEKLTPLGRKQAVLAGKRLKNITFDDLKLNSPYNTYINAGLPPTPIANPGIEALKAVVNPADTNYIYYVSDKSGHLHFARNLGEQNQNIQKYEVN